MSISIRHLEDYALTISVSDSDDAPIAPKDEPAQDVIENMARRHLLCQGITALAAYEVILFLKANLKKKIELEQGISCRLLGTADVLKIAKHAMGLLKSVFVPYTQRLRNLSRAQLREVCQRIAGVYHREATVNIWTGAGISFTGVSKLYYDCTSLNKFEATKLLCGFDKDTLVNIYYLNPSRMFFQSAFPRLKQIEAVVSNVMGAPDSVQ